MKKCFALSAMTLALILGGCQPAPEQSQQTNAATAPGAPGQPSTWSYAGKTGIGTSYEQYEQGQYQQNNGTGAVSKVWFSLAQGILTETMAGLIHEAQLREMQLIVTGPGFVDEEKTATVSTIDYLAKDDQGRPTSLAFKVVNKAKNGQYEIEKHYFTDPHQQSMVVKTYFKALAEGLTVYTYLDPALNNTGSNDSATVADGVVTATEGNTSLTLVTMPKPAAALVGFVGVSDGLTALKAGKAVEQWYSNTGSTAGNVAALLAMPTVNKGQTSEWQQVIGFGQDAASSAKAAQATLSYGLDKVLADYNGEGAAIGWQDYLASLSELPKLATQSNDQGRLLYASAMVLKAQEDKTHAGALIASLSNPWGDNKSAEVAQTGYKAVWPRDFYQVAMAMLALGDTQSPKVAFSYLEKVQVKASTPGFTGTPGWFLQKTHVDGQIEWVGVQMDQTAMPIMLGWRLSQAGILSDAELADWYQKMLKPAADFLAKGGKVKLDWNDTEIIPPSTQQERWEEQAGYSPSTIAAIISGLVTAAEIAGKLDDQPAAQRYAAAADQFSTDLEKLTFTTEGKVKNTAQSDGQYYLRINKDQNPSNHDIWELRNGQEQVTESEGIDGGFLELVRYGVRSADHAAVLATLGELDDETLDDMKRVKYSFSFGDQKVPGWRRYGHDGYGEDIKTGLAYAKGPGETSTAEQRGRVWPIFSGERGHYELAKLLLRNQQPTDADLIPLRQNYVAAMEHFANAGLMLPEQVFDGIGNNEVYQFELGEGTNGATPLAWSHAEYIKLLRSMHDRQVFDHYTPVASRYQTKK